MQVVQITISTSENREVSFTHGVKTERSAGCGIRNRSSDLMLLRVLWDPVAPVVWGHL